MMPITGPTKKQIDGHAVLVYSLLFFGAFLLLIPFYWMLSNSLKTEAEAMHIPPTLLPMASYIELDGELLEVALSEKDDKAGTVRVTVKMPEHPLVGKTIDVPMGDVTSYAADRLYVDGDYLPVIRIQAFDDETVEVVFDSGEVRRVEEKDIVPVSTVMYGDQSLLVWIGDIENGIYSAEVFPQPHPRSGESFVVAQSDEQRKLTPRWGNYPKALAEMNFKDALANTTVITVLCVIGQILSSSLVGFGFARFRFRGRNFLFMLMLSTMMLPPQVSMIPLFIMFRHLGMIDSIWPLVIPMWLGSPFYVFMFRQFFTQVPEELVEAARIDGAGNMMIYWRLMLPLSGPVIAIVAIYTFMFTWNDFLGPLIYLNSPEQRTLTLALNAFKGQYGTSDVQLLMAASFVTMLPCILLFFAAQRYFVQSTASSGLKG